MSQAEKVFQERQGLLEQLQNKRQAIERLLN